MKLYTPLQTLSVLIAVTASLCWSTAYGGEAFDIKKFIQSCSSAPSGASGGPAAKPPASQSGDPCKNITVNISGEKIEMKNNSNTAVAVKVHVQKGNSCETVNANLSAHQSVTVGPGCK